MRRYLARTIKGIMTIGEPVQIPQILIERFAPLGGARFLKVAAPQAGDNKSGKNPIEKGWQDKLYDASDESLQEHLKGGGNYGVAAGQGVALIDTDDKDTWLKISSIIKSFAVQSGRGEEGRHGYFRSDATENGVILDKNGKNLANIQVHDKFVVGPNSRHWTGGIYKVVDDRQLNFISKAQLDEIFGESLHWAGQLRAEHEQEAKEENEKVKIPLDKIIDLTKLHLIHEGHWQGEHPIHGSTTGKNFDVNTEKNVWHCFRCNSGGGPIRWLAVKNGIIQCCEAQQGSPSGKKRTETLQIARDLGFDVELQDETLNPDVERFFEGDKSGKTHFVPVYVAAELLKENRFLTQTTKGLMFWYNPTNGIYERKAEDLINAEVARKLGKHYDPWREKSVEAYIKARTIKDIPKADAHLLAVKNGILDVRTRELKPFNPEHIIFNAIPVTYDPSAKCPQFDKFLPEVVPLEKDRTVLQEHAGYTLLKDNKFQKALMLTGRKQNGKSTFLRVIEALLGEENVSNIPLQILSDSTYRFFLSQLYGKMANINAELPPTRLKETDNFKNVVSGDPVTAEFKGVTPFTFHPYAKLFYAANQLPELPKGDTEAFLVRWDMVEFPNTFMPGDPRRDPDLKQKLTTPTELSGVLNWCLEGLARLLSNNGFTKSDTLAELEDRWIVEGDTVKAFIDRCTTTTFGEDLEHGKAHAAYVRFCEKHKVVPLTLNRFVKAFQEITKVESYQTRIDNKPMRVWHGMQLKEEDVNEEST